MSPVQLLAIVAAIALLGTVIELVRRHRLTEEYSLIWISCAVVVAVFAMQRHWLDIVATRLGIFYPPALLLLGLGGFVLLIALAFSVAMSRQRRQIDQLAEEVAILEARVRALDRAAASAGPVPAGEVVPNATQQRHDPGHQPHVGRPQDVGAVQAEDGRAARTPVPPASAFRRRKL